MRLLVVEDDNTIREFLTRALTESGLNAESPRPRRQESKWRP